MPWFRSLLSQLSYDTTMMVQFHDWHLGLAFQTCQLLIFGYVGFYVVLYQKGYLVRAELSAALHPLLIATDAPIDTRKLPYCAHRGCQVWDAHSVRYPHINSHDILVTSFVTKSKQQWGCVLNSTYACNPNTAWQAAGPAASFYLPGVEHFHLQELVTQSLLNPFAREPSPASGRTNPTPCLGRSSISFREGGWCSGTSQLGPSTR
eukprot:NODE_621_length_1493_cov_92.170360_g461_i0.p1 GENE.NODE_621_length_1493_cov_92.170360_g461_i0~~NODE_621_length_1493_cov_92.170360_g461_i0.p1  ORF type:complete len:228 (-),score=47.25 NODE_621_length_1493_cov_92.170360_g461_i0:809-1426(-)